MSKVAYKALYWHNCIHSSNLTVCKPLGLFLVSYSHHESLHSGARFFEYSPWINQWVCSRKSLTHSFLSTQKPDLSTISLTSTQINWYNPALPEIIYLHLHTYTAQKKKKKIIIKGTLWKNITSQWGKYHAGYGLCVSVNVLETKGCHIFDGNYQPKEGLNS